MKKPDVLHLALLLSSVGTAVAEALAQSQGSLPWHLTAASCLVAATVFGAISKSLLADSKDATVKE
jgi:hypothetical protein